MLSIGLSNGTRRESDVVSLRVVLVDNECVFGIGQGIGFLQREIGGRFERFRLTENLIARHVEDNGFMRLTGLLSRTLRVIGRIIHRTIERGRIVEDIARRFLRHCCALRLIVRDAQLILLLFVLLDKFRSMKNFFPFLRLFVH